MRAPAMTSAGAYCSGWSSATPCANAVAIPRRNMSSRTDVFIEDRRLYAVAAMTTSPRLILSILVVSLSACAHRPAEPAYDVVITGGSLVDGTGGPPVEGDLGIRDGK